MNSVNNNFNNKKENKSIHNENKRKNLYDNSINNKSSLDSNNKENLKENEQSFFIMTLECENGKFDKIKIYPDSEPEELAFNFCIQNDLDCTTMKYITQEIKELLIQFKKNSDLQELSNQFFKQKGEVDKNFLNEFDNNLHFQNNDEIVNTNFILNNNDKNENFVKNKETLSFKIEEENEDKDNNYDNNIKIIEEKSYDKEENLNENNNTLNSKKDNNNQLNIINKKTKEYEKIDNNMNNFDKKSIKENKKTKEDKNEDLLDKKSIKENKKTKEDKNNDLFDKKETIKSNKNENNNKNEKNNEIISNNEESEISSSFLNNSENQNVDNTIKSNKNEISLNESVKYINEEDNINDNKLINKSLVSQKSKKSIKSNFQENKNLKLNVNDENFIRKIPTQKFSFQKIATNIKNELLLGKRSSTPIKTNKDNIKEIEKKEQDETNKFELPIKKNENPLKNEDNNEELNVLEHQIEFNKNINQNHKKIIPNFRKLTKENNDINEIERIKTYSKSNLVSHKQLKKESPKKIQFANIENDKVKKINTLNPISNNLFNEKNQKNNTSISSNNKIKEKEEIKNEKREESLISNSNKLNLSEKENIKENKKFTTSSPKEKNNFSFTSENIEINRKVIYNKTFIGNQNYIPVSYKEKIDQKIFNLNSEEENDKHKSFYSSKTPRVNKTNTKKSNSNQKNIFKRNISPNTSISKNYQIMKQSNSNTTILEKNNTSKRSKSSARKSNKINYGEYLYKKGVIDNKIKNEKIRRLKIQEEKRIIANCSFSPKVNQYHPFKNKSFTNLKLNQITEKNNSETNKKKNINENTNHINIINKINSYNSNERKKKKPKKITLTKSDIQKIYLKKNLKLIKTESEKNYTFKPKINNNYNCSPGIIFFQRQEIYQQYKKRKDMIKPESTRRSKQCNLTRNKFRPNSTRNNIRDISNSTRNHLRDISNSTRNNLRDISNSKSRDKKYSFNSFFSDGILNSKYY